MHWGVPKIIIGATIISLGTTLPEASVSVIAALGGQSDLALGNAVGSIIANSGLILGLAAVIGSVPVDRKLILRQGSIMAVSSFAVVLLSLPFFSKADGGYVSRLSGMLFVVALVIYLYTSIRSARKGQQPAVANELELDLDTEKIEKLAITPIILKMAVSIALIIVSSRILISSVEITAIRVGIPQGIIAATLVAFGTSLPELILAVKSVRKGHGELALGNIVGANILNVLFVIGISAAVTAGGLHVPDAYYRVQYPALLLMMFVFAYATLRKKTVMPKLAGILLMTSYGVYLLFSYI